MKMILNISRSSLQRTNASCARTLFPITTDRLWIESITPRITPSTMSALAAYIAIDSRVIKMRIPESY
jgi:hypothetical protein